MRKCNRECEHLAIVAKNFYDDVLSIEEEEEEEEEPEPEETEEERKERICALPSELGPCRARFDRFYYDAGSNSCKKFTFGGCEGNENNFQAKSDCQELCVNEMLSDYTGGEEEDEEGDLPDLPTASLNDECDLPATSGFCRGFFTRWHWNTDSGSCETFVWGGCGGNANNFETEEGCQQKCQPQERSMVYDFVDDNDEEDEEGEGGNAWDNLFGGGESSDDLIDPCDLSIQRGPCRALYPKWAFDGENCVSFMYGGCMGNANNFGSLQECRKTCQDSEESNMVNDFTGSDTEDDEDEENFAAVFPTCTTTGEGKFDQISYSSKMTCTSLGNSHHSGDPETEFLSIDGLTDAPSADRVKTFVERFPKLKVLVLNGLELNDRLNIQLPASLKIFISKNSGWTKISEDTFLRAGALRKINLSGNLIQRLTANQFRSQKYLMKVDLSDNLIGQIPDGLFTSSKRQFCDLILDGNDIEGFSRRTFYGLRKLKKLSVKENPLSQGLEDFLFSQNPILKCVLLTDSGIEKLGKNVFSSSKNPKLRQVDLSGADNMPKYLRKDWDTKKKVWEKLMMKL